MKTWTEERCQERPEELELVAPDTYMQRRNITKVEHEADETAGTPAYNDYACESREISVSEYEMLKSIEDISTSQAIDAYTEQLIEGGLL